MRNVARVIVLDPEDRVLLIRPRDAVDGPRVWFMPGGSVEPGESLAEAAARELAEEVPQVGALALRGPVWRRQHDFRWNGMQIGQTEWYFVGRLERPVDASAVHVGSAEETYFDRARWASVADLAGWPSTELVAPRRLAVLLAALLAGDWPADPIDVGV